MKTFIFLLLLPQLSFAWTLNNNFAAAFKDNDVKVFVDASSACPGITTDDLHGLIQPAIDDFWNRVPTSALRLNASGFSTPLANINIGTLCSPTDDTCISNGNADGDLIPATDNIVIACNNKIENFGTNSTLAVTIPVKFTGKKIKGAIILINENSDFFNFSRSDQIGIISHEIGHAIGLGHSDDKASLMYYRTVNQRKRLGDDDIKGVSFLYPIQLDVFGLSKDGLLGGCGTIDTDNKTGPKGPGGNVLQMLIGFFFAVILMSLFKRAKTRSAL